MSDQYLLDGKYAYKDLVDINRLRLLLESFSKITGFVTGMTSHPDQELFFVTGGTDICLEFHRKFSASNACCIQSNIELTSHLSKSNGIAVNPCKLGMVDGAVPIIISGVHVANLFIGQVFFKKPDMGLFKEQSKTYGYDLERYLEAVKKVSIITENKFKQGLIFLGELAVMLADQGLAELKKQKEQFKLEKLESIGILAGGIAHDFNNSLTGLFGNIELAQSSISKDHLACKYLERSMQALEQTTSLTKQLLTFAKGGNLILNEVNLKSLVYNTVKFNLTGSSVKVRFNMPDNLWDVKADKGQISQVLANLIINAQQAMPNGGNLVIDAKNIEKNTAAHLSGDFVELRIQDEGTGIDKKYLEKIFDPYFTTKQNGTGLGLAISYSIVTKHNGHLSIDSTPDIGTVCTICLPAAKDFFKAARISHFEISEKLTFVPGHILVMDDEKMIREVSAAMLEKIGYTVECAIDGKAAVEKYITRNKNSKAFDAVIMDLTIPGGMGGEEAINELLAIDPEARVIVSSGYSTGHVMENYHDYGFKGRLVKPFEMKKLKTELFRVVAIE